MKILFDHQCYWETYGGVSRYFTEILKTDIKGADYELALKFSNNEYLKELNFKHKNFMLNVANPRKQYIISAINKPNSIKAVKNTDANIVHITHYDPYLFKYAKDKLVISTIHDLNFFAIPQFFHSKINPLIKWQVECAKKSDYIIAISENTKKDLIQYLSIPEEKIKVIYHGISNNFRKTKQERLIKNPYLLFVGWRHGFKNFETVLNSFIKLKQKDLFLVCTGHPFTKNEIDLFHYYGITDNIININANEEELKNLYSNAVCFVYPSFYEGFGFPLLEAMACECPVLCSNASCFPEIAGDAAIYFNPNSVSDCTDKLMEIIKNSSLREEMIYKGLIQKNKYSWDISRKKHFELYQELDSIKQ